MSPLKFDNLAEKSGKGSISNLSSKVLAGLTAEERQGLLLKGLGKLDEAVVNASAQLKASMESIHDDFPLVLGRLTAPRATTEENGRRRWRQ